MQIRWIVLLLAILVIISIVLLHKRSSQAELPEDCDRFLLVIAHPDDEVIFFRPTMSLLQNEGKKVSILCLTNGDHAGLGVVRTAELYASAAAFGIPSSRVKVGKYRDGRQEVWDLEMVERDVADFVRAQDIQVVVTFDDYGITGHANHVSCYKAVRNFLGRKEERPLGLSLASRSVLVKALGPLSVFVLDRAADYVWSSENVAESWRHMHAHASQFVWYRKLLILFSRYSYVNAYRTI